MLPKELQGKNKKEVKKIVEKKKHQREAIQKKMRILENKRAKFIADKKPKDNKDFGSAIIKSIQEQATRKGFSFSK